MPRARSRARSRAARWRWGRPTLTNGGRASPAPFLRVCVCVPTYVVHRYIMPPAQQHYKNKKDGGVMVGDNFQFSLGAPDSGFSLFLAERTKKVEARAPAERERERERREEKARESGPHRVEASRVTSNAARVRPPIPLVGGATGWRRLA